MSNSDDFICNVLIMGKTGTGKSTLLNYLCDKKIADTGTGKPVTGEGIYEYKVNINDQEVRLFDSWGIEAGKTEKWKQLIADALKEHGVQKSMEDWFHCVIYCIQAGGSRVEDIDSEIIQRFLRDGYHLTIILTKADQVAEDDESKMKEVILNEISGAVKAEKKGFLKVIATCAEQKKTRSGETEPFGKEEAIAAIFDGWKDTIIDRVPKHIIGRLFEKLDGITDQVKQDIMSNNGIFISGREYDNKGHYADFARVIKEIYQNIPELMTPIINDTLEMCHRANLAIGKIFNVPLDTEAFNEEIIKYDIPDSLWDEIVDKFLDLPIISWFGDRYSSKHIDDQKEKLCKYIDKLTNKLKTKIKGIENQLSVAIEKAL